MEINLAEWLIAIGTLVLAVVAAFQDPIRSWVRRPRLNVTARTGPPDCVLVPITTIQGQYLADAIYLRLRIESSPGWFLGKSSARQVEVFAETLRRQQADKSWAEVKSFPPMNLKWANLGQIYFPSIAPGMGKHCDLGHIVDPAKRQLVGEENPNLGLNSQQVSLAFDLMVSPNHKGHIIGPGLYKLDVVITAENAKPIKRTVEISIPGPWYANESRMLSDGVGIRMV